MTDTVTVKAESPMIETQEAKTSFSISGELLRAAPVTNRGLYSDAIDMVPGIQSRQGVDGSGVRVYYFMGSTQNAGYTALEGAPFGGFANPTPARTSMSTETVGDSEIRTGGSEASTPLSLGIYMNIIAPQGGNAFKGGASFAFQPLAWNSDNSMNSRVSGGVPKPEAVRQLDLSLGGPIVQDKLWFFSSYRWASDINGISRTPLEPQRVDRVQARFRSVPQHVADEEPLRQGERAAHSEPLVVGVLSLRPLVLHIEPRVRRGSDRVSIRRWVADASQAELRVGPAPRFRGIGRIQQQGQ